MDGGVSHGLIDHRIQLWTLGAGSYLVFDSPSADIVKVLALVFGIEIRERRGALLIEPDLAENTGVGVTHEGLADRVQTMG